jgi:hypothetical protein
MRATWLVLFGVVLVAAILLISFLADRRHSPQGRRLPYKGRTLAVLNCTERTLAAPTYEGRSSTEPASERNGRSSNGLAGGLRPERSMSGVLFRATDGQQSVVV